MEVKLSSKTNFLIALGSSPINKVLDFLIENRRGSWTMVEISKNARVGYSTLKIVMPNLLKNGLVKINKKVGKSNLFVINDENPTVEKLEDFRKQINLQSLKKFK